METALAIETSTRSTDADSGCGGFETTLDFHLTSMGRVIEVAASTASRGGRFGVDMDGLSYSDPYASVSAQGFVIDARLFFDLDAGTVREAGALAPPPDLNAEGLQFMLTTQDRTSAAPQAPLAWEVIVFNAPCPDDAISCPTGERLRNEFARATLVKVDEATP